METFTPPPIETTTASVSRPTAITVICVIGFIGVAFTIPLIFTDIARHIGAWYPPYLAFRAVVVFVCMVGLWKMRRWAVFTYTGFCALNQIVMMAMGEWSISELLFPGIVIAIAFSNLSKMSMTMLPKSPEPTAVGAVSSVIAVYAESRRWLRFFRSAFMKRFSQIEQIEEFKMTPQRSKSIGIVILLLTVVILGAMSFYSQKMASQKNAKPGVKAGGPANGGERGSISATDLTATSRYQQDLFDEWQTETAEIAKKTAGNQIASEKEIPKVNDKNLKKVVAEYGRLQNQMVRWTFTVSEVSKDFVCFRETPTAYYVLANPLSHDPLFIWFDDEKMAHNPGYLQIAEHLTRSSAEKLRPGDSLVIRGRAKVNVLPYWPGRFRVLIRLSDIKVAIGQE